jgi:transmembrane sensor
MADGDGIYQTGIGETSTLTLADGSTVTLNARSRIEVSVSDRQRRVDLHDGQAFFKVARDGEHPFVVGVADRDVTALGTAFDVRLDSTSVRVTLLEGKVRISQDPLVARAASQNAGRRQTEPRFLSPGQQFVAELPARTEPVVRDVDVSKAVSWRDGRVFLENLTLAAAVAEMNRYSTIQITVADTQIANLRVNGMFRAGEQEAFITALQEYFPITTRREGASIILAARP